MKMSTLLGLIALIVALYHGNHSTAPAVTHQTEKTK